jgi:hypothetical protein
MSDILSYPADVCTNNGKKRDDKYLTSYPDNIHDVHTGKGRTRGFAGRTASGG